MRRFATLLVLTAVGLSSACASGAARHLAATSVPPSVTVAPTTSSSTSPPTTPRPSTTSRPLVTAPPSTVATGVGTTMIEVVDPTRPTVDHGRTLSTSRHLPTIIRYPAVGPVGAQETSGAPVASGSWPLVIFAHGYNVTPATYAHLLHAWAAAGFVVAAPAFPLETAGGPLDENDLNNEPADISVVITGVLRSVVAGHIQASHIAVTGHSDGAEAALGAGFVSGDTRIGPVISMAAQGVDGMPHHNPAHPLLVVQGTNDTINPPARSDGVYAAAGPPRFYLHLLGGGHLPPVADATPWRPIVEQVSIDFLRRYLGGSVSISALTSDATHAGLSSFDADP